jgi:pSer/pThr/pTyr-binding forkhead associated (FHA) protein
MKPRLLEKTITGEVREIPLQVHEFLIGRGSDCDLCLHHSDVSRHHSLIHVRRDEVILTDLGSSNGTFLNGQRVVSQAVLKTGDLLEIGSCAFYVDLGDQGNFNPFGDVDELAQTTRTTPKELARQATIEAAQSITKISDE